jgi:hypothetical protein
LFELISALESVPFKLQIDIHVTRSDSRKVESSKFHDKNHGLNEKTVGEKDLEALSVLPSLTRQSSGSDQTDDNSETMNGSLSRLGTYRSLYTIHQGRPNIASIVTSFGASAEGESVAVAGQFRFVKLTPRRKLIPKPLEQSAVQDS